MASYASRETEEEETSFTDLSSGARIRQNDSEEECGSDFLHVHSGENGSNGNSQDSDIMPSRPITLCCKISSTMAEALLGGKCIAFGNYLKKDNCTFLKDQFKKHAVLKQFHFQSITSHTKELRFNFLIYSPEEMEMLKNTTDEFSDFLETIINTERDLKDLRNHGMRFYCYLNRDEYVETVPGQLESRKSGTASSLSRDTQPPKSIDLKLNVTFEKNPCPSEDTLRDIGKWLSTNTGYRIVKMQSIKPANAFVIYINIQSLEDLENISTSQFHELMTSCFTAIYPIDKFFCQLENESECYRHFKAATKTRAQVHVPVSQQLKQQQEVQRTSPKETRRRLQPAELADIILYIYIPEEPHKYAIQSVQVNIYTDSRRPGKYQLVKKSIETHGKDVTLWEAQIEIPQSGYYNYSLTRNNDRTECEELYRNFTPGVFSQHDKWNSKTHNSDSKNVLLLSILHGVNHTNLKSKLTELEEFHQVVGTFEMTDSIKSLHYKYQDDTLFQSLFLQYLSMTKPSTIKKLENMKLTKLLISCEKMPSDVRYSQLSMNEIRETLISISKLLEMSWIDLLTYTHAFLDEDDNIKLYKSFSHMKFSLNSNGSSKQWLERRRNMIHKYAEKMCGKQTFDDENHFLLTLMIQNIDINECSETFADALNTAKGTEIYSKFCSAVLATVHPYIDEEFKNADRDKDLTSLKNHWKLILVVDIPELKSDVRRISCSVMKHQTTNKDNAKSNADIVECLFEDGAFPTAEMQFELFASIIRSYSYYRVLPNILSSCGQLVNVEKHRLTELVLEYLDKSLGRKESKHSRYIKEIFDDYDAICSIDSIGTLLDEEAIEDRFLLHLTSIRTEHIIQTVKATDLWSDRVSKLFFLHVVKLVEQNPTIYSRQAEEFCHKHTQLHNSEKAKCVKLILEGKQFPDGREEILIMMLDQPSFWTGILNASGKYSSTITSSPLYKSALKALSEIKHCLEMYDVSWNFLQSLGRCVNQLDHLYHSDVVPEGQLRRLVNNCAKERQRIVENVCKDCFSLLEILKERFCKTTINVALNNCHMQLKIKLDAYQESKINLAKYRSFLQEFLQSQNCIFPNAWKVLLKLASSEIFWKIESCQYTKDYSDNHPTEWTFNFLKYLSENAVDRYKKFWKAENIQLKEALNNCTEVKDMTMEYDIAKQCLKTSGETLLFPFEAMRLVRRIPVEQDFIYKTESVCQMFIPHHNDQKYKNALTTMKEIINTTEIVLEKSLKYVGSQLKLLFELKSCIDEQHDHLFEEITTLGEVYDFLKPILQEDIGYLVDAAEEFEFVEVTAKAVSSLLSTKSFLQRLLSSTIQSPKELLNSIQSLGDSIDVSDIATCKKHLSALKSLYNGLSDKEQLSKEAIGQILQNGVIVFQQSTDSLSCEVYAVYRISDVKKEISSHRLQDLRSQALFIATYNKPKTEYHNIDVDKLKRDMKHFVRIVDKILDISQMIDSLQDMGHYRYGNLKWEVSVPDLNAIKQTFEQEINEWESCLEQHRSKCIWLNYIYGEHIQQMYRFLSRKENTREVDMILRYVNPTVGMLTASIDAWDSSSLSVNTVLERIGHYLDNMFENLTSIRRPFGTITTTPKLKDIIIKGRLLIVRIENEHASLSKTLLALYLNTSQILPEPHQVVLCNHTTQWNEISLLLKRCLIAGQRNEDGVYCIAGIETLTTDLKLKLAHEIKLVEEFSNRSFRLGLIFKGNIHESFLNFYREYVVSVCEIATMSDEETERFYASYCKDVQVVSSDIPGVGKTEYIMRCAQKEKRKLLSFHISGTFTKQELLQDFLKLNVTSNDILHIDIGIMDATHAHLLDNFIFEMMVLRVVTSGTMMCRLDSNRVYIELPNTYRDCLKKEMPTVSYFGKHHIDRSTYLKGFIVSNDPLSPVQIVCRYLKAYDQKMLDNEDILITDSRPLDCKLCIQLLEKYFMPSKIVPYTNVNIFLNVLSDQLKKFSKSHFFKVQHCNQMVIRRKDSLVNIRSKLMKTLLDRAKEMSIVSLESSKTMQNAAYSSDYRHVSKQGSGSERNTGIVNWENSCPFLVVFNYNGHSVTPLYRKLNEVPEDVQLFFKNQMKMKDGLPKSIYDIKGQEQNLIRSQSTLKDILMRIVKPRRTVADFGNKHYILTPDNMLKMILIYQRLKARLPVVIVGETGCGKTSLLRYLAEISYTNYVVMNIHAGLSKHNICEKIHQANNNAMKNTKKQLWVFLDEINTTEHIGILSDVICHRKIVTCSLAPNICFIAACNPYRLRSSQNVLSCGLDGKIRKITDKDRMSHLVYRVHPLPETIISHVWDFGVVNENDENVYITRMVENSFANVSPPKLDAKYRDVFGNLLLESQRKIREYSKEEYSVSLRDIDRCLRFLEFFLEFIQKKGDGTEPIRAIVLALAQCYYYRLRAIERRHDFRECLAKVLRTRGEKISEATIKTILEDEQKQLLDKMSIPDYTARNPTLKENVFVLLVSILTKTPIFLIGEPGCSKSLSIQLIRRNLKGMNSENRFFKTLPSIIFVSYQGSESSTSRGIDKVFDRAKNYQNNNKETESMFVVLLDEVGLAEISPNNPLKVLHNLLEPDGRRIPDVPVIGISNWALDAAKMNRAIHLSRPRMSSDELVDTVLQIAETITSGDHRLTSMIKSVAHAYMHYIQQQTKENFHGLRDIYALTKFIAKSQMMPLRERLVHGVRRNFGGNRSSLDKVKKCFIEDVSLAETSNDGQGNESVLSLIQANVNDKDSRHLMVISSGDVGLVEIKRILKGQKRPFEIMFGSDFPLDRTEEFDNNSLSRVILCMERGKVLIIKDFKSIYGSLYDMLNCNYMTISEKDKEKKQYCRIAYGPYSNPMCLVHDDFRCVVVVNDSEIDELEPPFLNRFEKQALAMEDVVGTQHCEVADKVDIILKSLIPNDEQEFQRTIYLKDIMPLYSRDTLLSLALQSTENFPEYSNDNIVEICVRSIICVCKPEAVLRFEDSTLYAKDSDYVKSLMSFHKRMPLHHGLNELIKQISELSIQGQREESTDPVKSDECLFNSTSTGLYLLLTHCNIHSLTNIDVLSSAQRILISDIQSLQELVDIVETFYSNSSNKILFIHLNWSEESRHLDIIKNSVETFLYKSRRSHPELHKKRVAIILHMDRSSGASGAFSNYINFTSGWNNIYLDDLAQQQESIFELCQSSLHGILKNRQQLLIEVMKKELPWAFTRIQYEDATSRSLQDIQKQIEHLSSQDILEYLFDVIMKTIAPIERSVTWIKPLAYKKSALVDASTFRNLVEMQLSEMVLYPMAKVVYRLEELGAIDILCSSDCSDAKKKYLLQVLLDEKLFSIDKLVNPNGPGCYVLKESKQRSLPVSGILFDKINLIMDEMLLERNENTYEDIKSFAENLRHKVGVFFQDAYDGIMEDYLLDFCETCSIQQQRYLDKTERLYVWLWVASHYSFTNNELIRHQIEYLLQNTGSRTFVMDSRINNEDYEFLSFLHMHQRKHKFEIDSIFKIVALMKNVNRTAEELKVEFSVQAFFEKDSGSIISSPADALEFTLKESCCLLVSDTLLESKPLHSIWHNTAISISCLASITSNYFDKDIVQDALKIRFCCDVVSLILMPLDLPLKDLVRLWEILREMCTVPAFREFTRYVNDITPTEKDVLGDTITYVETLYVTRTLTCSPITTDVFCSYLRTISDKGVEPHFLKPMFQLIIDEFMPYENLAKFILFHGNEDSIPMNKHLQNIVFEISRTTIPLSIFSDIVENEMRKGLISTEDIDSVVLGNAFQIVCRDEMTFEYLVALSYLRVSIRTYIDSRHEHGKQFHSQKLQQVLKKLCMKEHGVSLFFWRMILQIDNLENHQIICSELNIPLDDKVQSVQDHMNRNPMHAFCREKIPAIFDEWENVLAAMDEENINSLELNLPLCAIFLSKIFRNEKNSKVYINQSIAEDKELAKKLIACRKHRSNKDQISFLEMLVEVKDFKGDVLSPKATSIPRQLSSFLLQLGGVVLFEFKADNLFYKMITLPNNCWQWHVPGQGTDPIKELICISCKCGCRFFISQLSDTCPNCQNNLICQCVNAKVERPHARRCNECGNYKPPLPISNTVQKLGFAFESKVKDKLKHFATTNRNIPSLSFRMLELLVFGCLTISSALEHEIMSFNRADWLSNENLKDKMLQIWNALKELLLLSDENLLLFLRSFLYKFIDDLADVKNFQDEKTVRNWEQRFSDSVIQFGRTRSLKMAAFVRDYDRFFQIYKDDIYLKAVDEKYSYNNKKFDPFRLTASPTPANLLCELELQGHKMKNPFLRLVIENLPRLELIQSLEYFLRWYRISTVFSRYYMTRIQRKTLRIGEFIQNHMEKKILREEFSKVKDHWNKLCDELYCVKKLGFDVPELSVLKESSTIEDCLVTSQDSQLKTIIYYLATIQNEFIDKTLQSETSKDSLVFKFLVTGKGKPSFPLTSLHQLDSREIIDFSSDQIDLVFSEAAPYTGQGDVISYDFFKIESETVLDLLGGKSYICLPENLFEVQFKDDLFNNTARLLDSVRKLIPQCSLNDGIENDLKENIKETPSLATELLSTIGILLSVIWQSEESEAINFVQFLDRWRTMHNMRSYRNIQPLTDRSLTLGNIVPLYLLMEQIIGERIISELDMCNTMDPKGVDDLKNLSVSTERNLLAAICVLAHRELSTDNPGLDMESYLVDYLDNPAYWTLEQLPQDKDYTVFYADMPKNIRLKHIKSLYWHLKDKTSSTTLPMVRKKAETKRKRRI